MRLQDKFKELKQQKDGLLATNFYNYETLSGILTAASELQQPIILQLTRSSIEYMGLNMAVAMARTALRDYGVEGWLHLDHGDSTDLVRQCLDAGFDSVMIDGSELLFERNIELTAEVVDMAGRYNANVEAELGYVAKLGQSTEKMEFTRAEDARVFVEKTKVNALAVAIGTAHGFYKQKPKLDFDRLRQIYESTDAVLVLHGGSGVPDEDVKKCIELGVCKVNVATEIKNIFMKTLKNQLIDTDEIDLRKVFPHATKAVARLVLGKLKMVSINT